MNLNITEIILYINENLPKTFLKKNTVQSPAKYLFFFLFVADFCERHTNDTRACCRRAIWCKITSITCRKKD